MKVVVTSGDRQVSISAKGASPRLLKNLEETATRLLHAAPEIPTAKPFGFSYVAETQIATQEDE